MSDPARVHRSLGTIRNELEYLASAGILSPQQLQSIQAQLPQNGQPSQYVDPRYATGNNQFSPGLLAQQTQDPNNPAHPNHPKHHEWA